MVVKRVTKVDTISKVNEKPKVSKKNELIDLVKESSFTRTIRESKEAEAKKIAKEKQRIIDEKNEYDRQKKIIFAYLDKLLEQLLEKDLTGFWVFPENKTFKKLTISTKDMQKKLKRHPEKYAGKLISYVVFIPGYITKDPSKYSFKNVGSHIVINIAVFKIDVDGSFKDSWGCTFHWKNADFKTTKFSFKLIERILIPVSKKIKTCSSIASGTSITSLIKDLEKKGINFDDVLNPSAGV